MFHRAGRGHADQTFQVSTCAGCKVEFTAEGVMHDEPVRIKAIAFDGAGTKRPDHFSIKVFVIDGDNGGEHADFHAEGDVYKGDIRLGSIN